MTKPGQTLEFLLWGTIVLLLQVPHNLRCTRSHGTCGVLDCLPFVTKCGQTIEFLLWGTIVPLNFLVGYHCSIVASTQQPMAYAHTHTYVNTFNCFPLFGHSFFRDVLVGFLHKIKPGTPPQPGTIVPGLLLKSPYPHSPFRHHVYVTLVKHLYHVRNP